MVQSRSVLRGVKFARKKEQMLKENNNNNNKIIVFRKGDFKSKKIKTGSRLLNRD